MSAHLIRVISVAGALPSPLSLEKEKAFSKVCHGFLLLSLNTPEDTFLQRNQDRLGNIKHFRNCVKLHNNPCVKSIYRDLTHVWKEYTEIYLLQITY